MAPSPCPSSRSSTGFERQTSPSRRMNRRLRTLRQRSVLRKSRSATNAERDTISVRVWGPDVDTVEGVLAEGLEIWAGVDAANRLTAVFVAFGDEGRLAGVGHAAAEYLTIPVARLAAEAKAPSGFAYRSEEHTS